MLQIEMSLSAPHRNRYLFSDHYLQAILPGDERWRDALPEAKAFLDWLQDLYLREQDQLPDYNESQLEEHWIKPILTRLGHVFETQASVPGLDAYATRPDYVFFADEAARKEAAQLQNQDEYAAQALAVGEAKRWGIQLGKKRRGGGSSFDDSNPSWQIDYYLRATGADWGILSNGRLWRLVHEATSQRLQIYYEIDLVQLLSEADAEALRYFTLFFGQAAFRPDARGRVFLNDALAASNQYAVELEEDLEENVYLALERLMQGFLDLPANGLGPDDVRDIYDNSLYLLYRLLFILYGESRGLLALDNDLYRTDYSLERIKQDIARRDRPPLHGTTIYWAHLKTLFHIINGHHADINRELRVPRYNGGLFDPEQHPFLEQKQVGDRALVEAIDLLSRRETEGGREFADYRTLGVRHLGSIYEGLLEYQPRYAEEPMAAIREGGDERWVKASEAPEGARAIDHRDAGQVYLETDRGERKATGSYYTPQTIVEYIVEQTLGPLVDEATERVKERARQAGNRAAKDEAGQSLVDEVLELKVLDPAMGSGHFLVEATEFLALALATDPYVETTETPEEDLTYWKRQVVERCIYGVDKNPLAVELAKLSLWLATVAADRPLSFLDHHLKCGDALIGARVEDLGEMPPALLSGRQLRERAARYEAGARQANLFETRLGERLPTVMGRVLEITQTESVDYDTVRAKEAADAAVRALKRPFEAVADLWVSAYFGNAFINGEYDEALMAIGEPESLLAQPAVVRAQEIGKERGFFHWELAFPEVFYDESGQPLHGEAGFDAVVGNPPYVTTLDRRAREYFFEWSQTRGRELDTFYLFIERSGNLLSPPGRCSMIVPNVFMLQVEAARFRRFLLDHTVHAIVDHGFSVFGDATVPAAVLVWSKPSAPESHAVRVSFQGEDVRLVKQSTFSDLPYVQFNTHIVDNLDLLEKLESCSKPLSSYAESHEGVHSGNIRAKLFTRCPQLPSARRMLKGSDIDRYGLNWGGWYVNYDPALIERSRGDYASLREETIFIEPKILTRQTADRIIATWDDEGYYTDNTLHSTQVYDSAPVSPFYLLALLNSRLLTFVYQERTQERGRPLAQVKIVFLSQLPICEIDFVTPGQDRQKLLAAHAAGQDGASDSALLDLATDSLTQRPRRAGIVHDLLAVLAERLIAVRRNVDERVESFWLDLEGVTEADAFAALREHGKRESTLWRADPCRPFVREESHTIRHLDESLGWDEDGFKAFVKELAGSVPNLSDIVAVYRKHQPAYRDLVRRIEATDWLIDQIVYRLYGLTEEEIAIIEAGD